MLLMFKYFLMFKNPIETAHSDCLAQHFLVLRDMRVSDPVSEKYGSDTAESSHQLWGKSHGIPRNSMLIK